MSDAPTKVTYLSPPIQLSRAANTHKSNVSGTSALTLILHGSPPTSVAELDSDTEIGKDCQKLENDAITSFQVSRDNGSPETEVALKKKHATDAYNLAVSRKITMGMIQVEMKEMRDEHKREMNEVRHAINLDRRENQETQDEAHQRHAELEKRVRLLEGWIILQNSEDFESIMIRHTIDTGRQTFYEGMMTYFAEAQKGAGSTPNLALPMSPVLNRHELNKDRKNWLVVPLDYPPADVVYDPAADEAFINSVYSVGASTAGSPPSASVLAPSNAEGDSPQTAAQPTPVPSPVPAPAPAPVPASTPVQEAVPVHEPAPVQSPVQSPAQSPGSALMTVTSPSMTPQSQTGIFEDLSGHYTSTGVEGRVEWVTFWHKVANARGVEWTYTDTSGVVKTCSYGRIKQETYRRWINTMEWCVEHLRSQAMKFVEGDVSPAQPATSTAEEPGLAATSHWVRMIKEVTRDMPGAAPRVKEYEKARDCLVKAGKILRALDILRDQKLLTYIVVASFPLRDAASEAAHNSKYPSELDEDMMTRWRHALDSARKWKNIFDPDVCALKLNRLHTMLTSKYELLSENDTSRESQNLVNLMTEVEKALKSAPKTQPPEPPKSKRNKGGVSNFLSKVGGKLKSCGRGGGGGGGRGGSRSPSEAGSGGSRGHGGDRGSGGSGTGRRGPGSGSGSGSHWGSGKG